MRDGARIPQAPTPQRPVERAGSGGAARKAGASPAPAPTHVLPRAFLVGPVLPAPHLRIDPADSPLEREADRMSEGALEYPGQAGITAAGASPPVQPPERPGEARPVFNPPPHALFPGSGTPLPDPVRRDHEARLGHSFRDIRIHTGDGAADAARGLGALAFTVGRHIGFSRGAFAPHTGAGRGLLAHELAHAVQWNRGQVAPGVVQLRRVPARTGLDAALPPVTDPVELAAAREGLARVLTRAWATLSAAGRTSVRTDAAANLGITFRNSTELRPLLEASSRSQLLAFAELVRVANPARTLGDPALIDTGPRPATSDATNLATLITNAEAIFTAISSGSRDSDLRDVFGARNVRTAKRRYARARARMRVLNRRNAIVTDRSGYNAEVGLGGLTNSEQISVSPHTIDHPSDHESVVTFIHESMHAGNASVDDFGYITQPSFTALPEATKLNNAAHYEVVPRRILGASHAFTGTVFVPAGTTSGSTTAPALTPREEAVRGASEEYRAAWTAGLNLHSLFVQVHRNPAQWNTLDLRANFSGASSGARFSNTLPYWSQVEGLTIHGRQASINPAGPPAQQPVTLIDIALSEGLVRKLSRGMNGVPQTEADATSFLAAHASAGERAAATTVDLEKALLVRLVRRRVTYQITGTEDLDVQVVARLARANRAPNYSDMLRRRTSSATFP
jgi:hypothetical protein